METNPTYAASLEDMIFEGRNKAYGAYVLRKIYARHLSQAILYAVSFFVVLLSLPMLAAMFAPEVVQVVPERKPHTGGMVPVTLPPTKEEVVPPKAQEPAPARAEAPTVKNTTPKVVDNDTPVVDEIPTQEDIQNANSGLVTTDGDGHTEVGNPLPGTGSATGDGTGTGTGAGEPKAPEIFYSAEFMPEFEGGAKKMMEFLGKNIRYPRAAQNQGIEGTVVVSFVVSTTGDITDIQVLKGLGYGTEEEALRVIKKMPRWKPGSQNGRKVPVRMTLPIRLELK